LYALDLAWEQVDLVVPLWVFDADPDRIRLGLGRRDLAPGLDRLSAALSG
jgi:hypothetical protein